MTGIVYRKRTNGVLYVCLLASLALGGFVLHLDRHISGTLPTGIVLLNILIVAMLLLFAFALAMHPSVTMQRMESASVVTLSYLGIGIHRIRVGKESARKFTVREAQTESGHVFYEIHYRSWVNICIASFARYDQFQSVNDSMGFGLVMPRSL